MSKRGSLIIFEGVDRCGKTTQVKLVNERLLSAGYKTFVTRFPERTSDIGQMINQYLKNNNELSDQAVHLLFSANRWEYNNLIKDKISSGTHVIIDRYAFSGVAFTAAKGLDFEWCKNPDRGLPKPDLVIQLNVDEECAKGRGGFGEERYEKVEFQRRVRSLYAQLAEENKDMWKVVDGSGSIDDTTNILSDMIMEIIKSEKN